MDETKTTQEDTQVPPESGSAPEIIEAEVVEEAPLETSSTEETASESPDGASETASPDQGEATANGAVNPAPEENQTTTAEGEMFTIRADETGDKVYLVREKKRYWIKNPETLAKLGFYLGKEKRIPFSELLQYPEGEPVDMTVPNPIMPWDKPEQKVESIAENPSKIWY